MGNFGGAHGTALFGDNPVAWQYRTLNNKQISSEIFGNIYGDATFLKFFKFHTSFGGDVQSGTSRSFSYPAYESYLPPSPNSYSEGSNFIYNWIWTNTLDFHKTIKTNHDIEALLGTETIDEKNEDVGGTTQNYFSFDPNFTTLSTGSGTVSNYSDRSSDGLFSLFGKLNYSYKEKYLISATIRRDGSSKFINNVYGWFPAVSAGWRISNEKFMREISWISDLKIRGSWGIMGNQLNVSPANGYNTFIGNRSKSYYDLNGTNNSLVQGFQAGQIGNPNAKWEKDNNSDIGLDASFLNGQLGFTIDYYNKQISGLLYNPQLLGTAGSSGAPPFVNIAKVRNNGFDLSLSEQAKITSDLQLTASLTLTSYNNKILKVTNNTDYFWTNDTRRFGTDFIRNQVGHPIGAFYGYKIVGFWNSTAEIQQADAMARKATGDSSSIYQTGEGLGRFRYADANHDGRVTSDDRTFLGNPNPKFSYGLNLGLTYKGFDFSMFFYGVQGDQLWNNLKWWLDFYPSFNTGKSKTALYDSWTPDHHNAKVSIQEDVGSPSTNGQPNSYYIENGSYFRAKNILLGYTFPEKLIKLVGVEKLRIYVQGINLFTITKYSGLDPEISGTPTDFGVDGGAYPHPHEFLVGINLDF
jgi:TonB-linked SusC/RagA family outer membrane protein